MESKDHITKTLSSPAKHAGWDAEKAPRPLCKTLDRNARYGEHSDLTAADNNHCLARLRCFALRLTRQSTGNFHHDLTSNLIVKSPVIVGCR